MTKASEGRRARLLARKQSVSGSRALSTSARRELARPQAATSVPDIVAANLAAAAGVNIQATEDGRRLEISVAGTPVNVDDPVHAVLEQILSDRLTIFCRAQEDIEGGMSPRNAARLISLRLTASAGAPPSMVADLVDDLQDRCDKERGVPNGLDGGERHFAQSSRAYLFRSGCALSVGFRMALDNLQPLEAARRVHADLTTRLEKTAMIRLFPKHGEEQEGPDRRARQIKEWRKRFEKGDAGPASPLTPKCISIGQLAYNLVDANAAAIIDLHGAAQAYQDCIELTVRQARRLF